MKDNKEKIEFWLHENQKAALKALSESTGYTLSELMRRGAEYVIRELQPSNVAPVENKEEPHNV
jgi:predicted DNA-binding protein|tara:strand:+ start:4604 stop:4795 length:192 start_codon:yes stop_codon:yes gene_type:complete